VPYPVPCSGFSPGVVLSVARAVLDVLQEPAEERAMFAASPRVPPPGPGWMPLPYMVPRIQTRLAFDLRRPGGNGYRLLRSALLTMANAELVELYMSPMAGSRLGRIRFVRACPRDPAAPPPAVEELIPDDGRLYEPGEGGW
jgi:hypothetical protein